MTQSKHSAILFQSNLKIITNLEALEIISSARRLASAVSYWVAYPPSWLQTITRADRDSICAHYSLAVRWFVVTFWIKIVWRCIFRRLMNIACSEFTFIWYHGFKKPTPEINVEQVISPAFRGGAHRWRKSKGFYIEDGYVPYQTVAKQALIQAVRSTQVLLEIRCGRKENSRSQGINLSQERSQTRTTATVMEVWILKELYPVVRK